MLDLSDYTFHFTDITNQDFRGITVTQGKNGLSCLTFVRQQVRNSIWLFPAIISKLKTKQITPTKPPTIGKL